MNAQMPVTSPPDPTTLRQTLGQFATGVAIVTGIKPSGDAVGLTISSFNSLSLEPPLVLWSLSVESTSRDAFEAGRPFVINVLSENQRAECLKFAKPGPNKFDDVATGVAVCGVPMLPGSIAQLECVTQKVIDAGDHVLYIGEVTHTGELNDDDPLLFHRSQLKGLRSESMR